MAAPPLPNHITAYDEQAAALCAEYERAEQASYRTGFADLVPRRRGATALDIGAGSGRDAAWLADLGCEVVAVEPAAEMRRIGRRLHADTPITWLDDRLPDLRATRSLELRFDFILLSGVWQHVAPQERRRALRWLTALLRPRGVIVISVRHGPAPPDRPMHEVSTDEVRTLAGEHGLHVARETPFLDTAARPGVSWTVVTMIRPDGGAPFIRTLRDGSDPLADRRRSRS